MTTAPVSIQTRWGMSAVGLLIAMAGFWGVKGHIAEQQREVLAPQRLLKHLEGVHQGRNDLDARLLFQAAFVEREEAAVRSGLIRDLRQSGHPDPADATDRLLPMATRYLRAEDDLVAVLTRRLQALPDDWTTVKKPGLWQVHAGDSCMTLAFKREEPQVLWQWESFQGCS